VLDAAAARVEVAHHVAEVVLGRDDLDGHHRLEELRLRALHRLLEGHRAGDLERPLARVDLVVGALDQLDLDVDDGVAREDTRAERFLDPLVDRLDVLLRDLAADDLVLELVALARLLRDQVDDDVAVLARAARLADEPALHLLDRAGCRLAVGHLGPADVGVDLELAHQAVDDDLEVQLAHPRDERLPRLLVGRDAEGRVLLGEPREALSELVLVALRLRLDGDRDHRVGERHRLEHDRRRLDGERVAGRRLLEPDGGGDLARADLLPLLAVVRVHLQDAPDPLGATARRVEHAVAGLHLAGVDAEVRELADVRVGHDLEDEGRERRVLRGRPRDLVVRLRVGALDGRDVERARQVLDDGVEQRLHALVLERRAEQHGCQRIGQRASAERAADHLGRHRRLVLEIRLRQLVVVLGDRVDQRVVRLVRGIAELGRDLPDRERLPEVVLVDDRLHLDEVDDAAVGVLLADGELDRHRVRTEPVAHRLHGGVEVGPGAVHLVDERDPRHAVAVGLPPDRLRLGLDAGDRVEHGHRAVEDAQRALHLDRKVHVPGSIDNVDPMVAPRRRRRRRRDRDAALLLLRHPVHRRGALVHLAELVGAAGVVEDPLGRRRLARVDVGHDPDVADAVERDLCGSRRHRYHL